MKKYDSARPEMGCPTPHSRTGSPLRRPISCASSAACAIESPRIFNRVKSIAKPVPATHEIVTAINTGQYDRMLPYLAENVEATSITQEVMSSRADVSKYFKDWFGPKAYMKKMEMKLEADRLTELSPDKTWGLARGKAVERYEANDGDVFDFTKRSNEQVFGFGVRQELTE